MQRGAVTVCVVPSGSPALLVAQIDEDKVVQAHKKDGGKGAVRFAATTKKAADDMADGSGDDGSDSDADGHAKVPRNLSTKILREVRPTSLLFSIANGMRRRYLRW